MTVTSRLSKTLLTESQRHTIGWHLICLRLPRKLPFSSANNSNEPTRNATNGELADMSDSKAADIDFDAMED